MYRAKVIKKKTRNRNILLQNLKKGKARKEARCAFQLIPYPLKFACTWQIYCVHADVVLMEHPDTLVSESSLFNNFKIYKTTQVVEYPGQKMMKVKVENNNVQQPHWRDIVERLNGSESGQMKEWADLIKTFCEKYEASIQAIELEQKQMSQQKLQSLMEMNARSEKTRLSIIKSFPCVEFRSQLKDGVLQVTEISPSEKYLAEIGYTFDNFAATVLEGGLPEVIPLNSPASSVLAKIRLQKCLTMNQDEYTFREFETYVLMKNGYMKKVTMRSHYLTYYEKGVLGFIFLGAIVSKQKPDLRDMKASEAKLNDDFVGLMSEREKEINNFLSKYYSQKIDQKYVNLSKICKIKSIKVEEEETSDSDNGRVFN